jgi:hypothetical protein
MSRNLYSYFRIVSVAKSKNLHCAGNLYRIGKQKKCLQKYDVISVKAATWKTENETAL